MRSGGKGQRMVIDTSALLAVIFNEPQGPRIAKILSDQTGVLCMSTVNLAECLILIEDRQPQDFEAIRETIYSLKIRMIAPSKQQAEIAAKARLQYPLNLGDCFAYALAQQEGVPLLTLDKDFVKTDLDLVEL